MNPSLGHFRFQVESPFRLIHFFPALFPPTPSFSSSHSLQMSAFPIASCSPTIHTRTPAPITCLHASPSIHFALSRLPPSSLKTHHRLVSSPSPFSTTTTRRKLLCPPPFGKYIREDYLVKKYSAAEIEELIKGERTVPLVIDFYATWCGPCILMAQELEMLAVEYESNALIVKVDTDDEYEFAQNMQVRGLPTVYFISPDPTKDAIRTEGLIPVQMMRHIINNEL